METQLNTLPKTLQVLYLAYSRGELSWEEVLEATNVLVPYYHKKAEAEEREEECIEDKCRADAEEVSERSYRTHVEEAATLAELNDF